MNYQEMAQPWQKEHQANYVLPIKRNSRFFYKHHPKRWDLAKVQLPAKTPKGKPTEVYLWLPQLGKHSETPGVNGTRLNNQRVDSSYCRARLQEDGWTLLMPDEHDYMRIYPGQNGKYHSTRFVKLEDLGGEVVETFDSSAFDAWRIQLMASGAIKPPHPKICKKLILEQTRRIGRHVRSQHLPQIAAKIKSYDEIKAAMIHSLAELQEKGRAVYEL